MYGSSDEDEEGNPFGNFGEDEDEDEDEDFDGEEEEAPQPPPKQSMY